MFIHIFIDVFSENNSIVTSKIANKRKTMNNRDLQYFLSFCVLFLVGAHGMENRRRKKINDGDNKKRNERKQKKKKSVMNSWFCLNVRTFHMNISILIIFAFFCSSTFFAFFSPATTEQKNIKHIILNRKKNKKRNGDEVFIYRRNMSSFLYRPSPYVRKLFIHFAFFFSLHLHLLCIKCISFFIFYHISIFCSVLFCSLSLFHLLL